MFCYQSSKDIGRVVAGVFKVRSGLTRPCNQNSIANFNTGIEPQKVHPQVPGPHLGRHNHARDGVRVSARNRRPDALHPGYDGQIHPQNECRIPDCVSSGLDSVDM